MQQLALTTRAQPDIAHYRKRIKETLEALERTMRQCGSSLDMVHISMDFYHICSAVHKIIELEKETAKLVPKTFVLDSREVAELIGKRHDHLCRDIQKYAFILGNFNAPKNGVVNFFIESTYTDNKGETRPRYLLTRKGCEFVANKMTGEKGIKFTADYINKFHEMEAGQTPTQAPALPLAASPTAALPVMSDTKAIYACAKLSDQYLKLSKSPALTEEQRRDYALKAVQALESGVTS